jgi:uncharacterized membrane protein YphA (DoxX/SURF4 family)
MSSAIRTLDRVERSVIDLRGEQPVPTRAKYSPRSILAWLISEIHKPASYLFPLRVFMGVGWLRSALEKFADPTWLRGEAVGDFLSTQTSSQAVAVPIYDWLIGSILQPASPVVGWLVMLLQVGIGLAILFGTYTNLALVIGVALNVNFMLAGEINPSAFYIVIQTVLFVTGAGAVLGFDQLLAKRRLVPSILMVAKPEPGASGRTDRQVVLLLAINTALMSLIGYGNVTDFSPTGIDDPALVLGTVMAVATFSLLILRLRMIDVRRFTPRRR